MTDRRTGGDWSVPQRPKAQARPVQKRPQSRGVGLGNPARRLGVASLLLGLVVALLVGRLVQVQGVQARSYAAVAQSERLRTVDVPAIRGVIYDRDGEVLARSVPARRVTADPTLIADPVGYANLLSPQLGVPADTLARKLSDQKRRYVVLARDIDPETWRRISETIDLRTGKKIKGVFSENTSKRIYPADAVAANVLGFVNAAGVGMGGVERAFDQLLAGIPGKQTYERSRSGGRIATAGARTTEPVPGQDLQLTIDREIQWYAQQAIAAQVRKTKAASGTVVIQDVATGEILAMATAPTFNPNHPGRGLDANRGNRALSEVYEPGSIAKTVSLAAVLDQQAATPDLHLTVPGILKRADRELKDHWDHGTIKLTLTGALAKSSNIGTVQAVDKISLTSLYSYMKAFGLGEPSGLGFPGESRGILPEVEDWNASQKYTVTFGQGFAVNTVQAASIYQTVGNGGVRIAPRLIKSWTDGTGRLHMPTPAETRRVVAPETAKTLTDMLEQVVARGGAAEQLKLPGYRMAGKTGTAQFANSKCGCYKGYTASFAGFAPADNPRLAISVTLQLPRKGYSGGVLAGPVFVKTMNFSLQALGVRPSGTKPARLPLTWK
ncbi:MAG: peptidoglycan D,D-transpeptidase FtsI family protein [Sporichthyaceae bacterium]